MIKGGYQIINFNDKNHELNVGIIHEGIYEKIEGTRKAILISGLVIDNVEYHDVFVFPRVVGSNFMFKIDEFNVTIEDTDVVTITNN